MGEERLAILKKKNKFYHKKIPILWETWEAILQKLF